jgi:EmrB/QacA subfamily drug resistance transporter
MKNDGKEVVEATGGWLAPVLICLIGTFMSTLDSSIVNVALSTIKGVFNTDMETIEWVVTIYSLSLGIIIPLSGWMGKRVGLDRVYMAALVVFTLGSVLCTLSWNIYVLIAMRVIQAFGGGMIMPTAMSMIKRIVPRKRYGTAMGIYGIAMLMGPALGPTLGGYLVEYVGWRWIFTINLPIGILGLILAYLYLPSFPRTAGVRIDVAGVITSATMLFCLLLALSKGADWGWASERIVLLFYVSAVSFILFLIFELKSENPLLELRLFRYRTFTMANLISVSITVGLYSVVYYVPIFLQSLRGMGAMETGMLMLPGAIIAGVMMPVNGWLYDKTGPRIMAVFGLSTLAITTYVFHTLNMSTPTAAITFWMALRYFSMSFAQMPAGTASIESVPAEFATQASAISSIITRVSSSFGIAMLTTIMSNRDAYHLARLREGITTGRMGVAAFLHQGANASISAGSPEGTRRLETIMRFVSQTAFVQALDDVFIIASLVTLVSIVPALFLKRGNP